ncbi:MBL fold metallo-hydrolase [Paenalcaligenes hominis]|uniref:MBL fold metallo-hydrolase n=1 Tax=Paenalcaligenes hominis TaxID=643674 RepID=A0A1U9K2J0_9BURK|nr:MBL fold metallo-hydrolase [Paenalcaligenes hominis]AQS52236.1 MBL fold metallo-hydrolase [Paenalcaligenes hominis]
MPHPHAQAFFDPQTSTYSYVVHQPGQTACAIIDPVLDYDPSAAKTRTVSAQKLLDYIHAHDLEVQWILETHAHADHLSAAAWLKDKTGARIAIGAPITQVQRCFKDIYHLGAEQPTDGSPFDALWNDGDIFHIGSLEVQVLHVPGHTPADMAYHVKGLGIFVGDTLFLPDVGTARCDFPGGCATQLYQSMQRLLSFPDDTVLFMCHDYPPNDRAPRYSCTVADQKTHNIHLKNNTTEAQFVQLRNARDATLGLPQLMLPALQINIQAGHLPQAEANQVSYLKIPLNTFN